MAALDGGGRIGDRRILRALDWPPDLCRSKSYRCWSSGVPVLVDESAEDAGAVQSAGVEVVDCGRLVLSLGW
jgi:hypothetical protein